MPTKAIDLLRFQLIDKYIKDHVSERPLLAHYSTMQVIETILREDTIWFSSPFYMNDYEEFRHGMETAMREIMNSSSIAELARENSKCALVTRFINDLYEQYEDKYARNLFIACFCRHEADDDDGVLSMWRAYGANGNGAALVIDSGVIEVVQSSPILIGKVNYLNRSERLHRIWAIISDFCEFARIIDDTQLVIDYTNVLFEAVKYHALTTKYSGFIEENEWRAVYFPERDFMDILTPMIDYWIGPFGIEPKLKLKLAPVPFAIGSGIQLDHSVFKIVLGPTRSSALSQSSFLMMLDKIGKPELRKKVVSSSIPLRERAQY